MRAGERGKILGNPRKSRRADRSANSIYLLNLRWLVFSSHTRHLTAAVSGPPCKWHESSCWECIQSENTVFFKRIASRLSTIACQHQVLQHSQVSWATIQTCTEKASFLNCFKKCIHLQVFSLWLTLIRVFQKHKMTTRKWLTLHSEDGLSYFGKIILNCIYLCQLAMDKSRYRTSELITVMALWKTQGHEMGTGSSLHLVFYCKDEAASSFVRKRLYKQKETIDWSSLYV